jgi:hypothetical protein
MFASEVYVQYYFSAGRFLKGMKPELFDVVVVVVVVMFALQVPYYFSAGRFFLKGMKPELLNVVVVATAAVVASVVDTKSHSCPTN